MGIAQATLDRIGQPESEQLEYKAVLPPAATIAQLICAFANTNGGTVVLGVVEDGDQVLVNGLSDEFRADQITRKAIDLLSPRPPSATITLSTRARDSSSLKSPSRAWKYRLAARHMSALATARR